MEIDLDNLVFSGLEEAEERNAERLDEADKKAQAIVADDDCGDACKIWFSNRLTRPVFFRLSPTWAGYPARLARLWRQLKPQMGYILKPAPPKADCNEVQELRE